MRVFKTRSIATDACKKGRVMMGGVAVKPSRSVKVGDVIDVRKPPVTFSFRVKAPFFRQTRRQTRSDYLENITPQSQYDLLEMTRISGFVDRRKGLGRPTKRDSREMSRFREESYADTFFLDWEDDDEDDED